MNYPGIYKESFGLRTHTITHLTTKPSIISHQYSITQQHHLHIVVILLHFIIRSRRELDFAIVEARLHVVVDILDGVWPNLPRIALFVLLLGGVFGEGADLGGGIMDGRKGAELGGG